MEMSVDKTGSGVAQVTLDGSLDIAGAESIDLQLSVLAGKEDKLMIDMAAVGFMASIGVRTLVKAAKAVTNRGGKLVVARPVDAVAKVLSTTGVDAMIGVYDDVDSALAALDAS